MKTRLVFGVLFFAAAFPAAAQTAPAVAPDWRSRLGEAIARAASQNPELAAMESRIEASRHRALQADTLPDPEIEVGIKDVPVVNPSLSRDDFTMEMVTARQMFPGPGKRATRKASAQAAAESAASSHAVHVIALAAEVADSFFMLAELDLRLGILERSRERLKQASASATERYKVGKGAQADVLRANLETTALEDRLLSLKAERRATAARFNALQNLPASNPVPPIEPVDPVPPGKSAPEILREAEERSPAVAAARASVRRAEEELKLARLERRPDWTAMTYYGRREKFEDLAGASLSFNLPFAHPRRLDERRAEMESELSSARADLESVRNQLRRDVEAAAAELERNVEQKELYRSSILPQAQINFRAAQEAYSVGQIDFLTFERAALDLDMYEGEIASRVSGVGRGLAALQKASGLPLIEGTPKPGGQHVEN
ncbi:MAG TPA: TolC family protein [Thermoanaerobaculia bacterium]|jgi:outer membrane protein TolC